MKSKISSGCTKDDDNKPFLFEDFANLNIIGQSKPFIDVLKRVRKVAAYDIAVSIFGETGTGKELIARAIHYFSPRSKYPFIPVNCGSLPDTLFENEMFGHESGAFTDARTSQAGLIAQAERGTLFLDEIEALPLSAQTTLLRFLQDKQYRILGGDSMKTADVHIVAASNENLPHLCDQHLFKLVQFLMTLTDDRVVNESAPFDHPEIFVPVTGSAEHPGNTSVNEVVRTVLLNDSENFQQVVAIGAGGRSAVFLPPLEPFLGLDPRDPALTDDIDLDTIGDLEDNCTLVANTHQLDTDDDGFGNICDADLDNSGNVDFSDFTLFSVLFGTSAPGVEPFTLSDHADFNGDGQVDFGDFTLFSVAFGRSPGPAAP